MPELDSSPDNAIEDQVKYVQNSVSEWWNRIRASESNTLIDSEVTILGKVIQPKDILNAINSRLWFTYRAGFEPIERAEDGPSPLSFLRYMLLSGKPHLAWGGILNNRVFCTDMGWGCMIRTSQSLLANALQLLMMGQQHTNPADFQGAPENIQKIIELFSDDYQHPFSLHNFIKAASELPLKVKPGEWFGPSAASLSIKRLCDKYDGLQAPKLRVFISENCNLYDDEIESALSINRCPLLILFPIRLGIDKINSLYYPSLLQLLSLENSVGIAGGKPSSSYYFFGYQGSNLLFLDPHNLQMKSSHPDTYHTSQLQSLEISHLDPSMLAGVIVHNFVDYKNFKLKMKENKIINFLDTNINQNHSCTGGEDYVHIRSVPGDLSGIDVVDIGETLDADSSSLPSAIAPEDGEYEFL